MPSTKDLEPDLSLPRSTFRHLRRALRKEAGPLGTTHILHDTGFAMGDTMVQELSARTEAGLSSLAEGEFWQTLNDFFEARGWGRVSQERVHPGVGLLRAYDWGESDPDAGEGQPSCALTSGLLAHVLGRAANAPVAVLEVGCRSRSDEHCAFLFGSEGAIHEIYGHLLDGAPLDVALERL